MASFTPATDIEDLSGKVILITGGNVGIGAAVVQALAPHDPEAIYICARNTTTAEALVNEIKETSPSTKSNLEVLQLDLSSFESVKKCAAEFKSKAKRLDIMFLHAGVAGVSPKLTQDGYEIEFGINHMGHALLTQLLLPKMLETKQQDPQADLRIVSTSSRAYLRAGAIDVSQMHDANAFSNGVLKHYGHSKLANILFVKKLSELYPTITSTAVHPGVVKSEIYDRARKDGSFWLYWLSYPVVALTGISTEEGAKTQLWAATADGVQNGKYYEPVANQVDATVFSDSKQIDELWDWTEKELAKHHGPGWPKAS